MESLWQVDDSSPKTPSGVQAPDLSDIGEDVEMRKLLSQMSLGFQNDVDDEPMEMPEG